MSTDRGKIITVFENVPKSLLFLKIIFTPKVAMKKGSLGKK